MKAVVCTRYGPPEVLELRELAKPVPLESEVLIRNRATTVHVGDVRIRRFDVPRWQWLLARVALGLTRPKHSILGFELAGEIEAVGERVTRFKAGDRVFGATFWYGFGGYAEYKCLPESGMLAPLPDNMNFEEAAAGVATGGYVALQVLGKARVRTGQKVLVYGASGSVGTFAVQLAKSFGAEVTGVCSTLHVEMVRALGADQVIDYTLEDFVRSGERYDVVFDAVDKLSRAHGKQALKPQGIYLNINRDSGSNGAARVDGLLQLRELIEAGKIRTVIDRTYPLEQIVEAHRYVEKGHKAGHVVVTV